VQKYEKSIQFARFPIEIVIANNEERIVWQSGAVSCYSLYLFLAKKARKRMPLQTKFTELQLK
jgi:hypothetical protein